MSIHRRLNAVHYSGYTKPSTMFLEATSLTTSAHRQKTVMHNELIRWLTQDQGITSPNIILNGHFLLEEMYI